MKNRNVIKEFVNLGTNERIKTKSVFFEGDVLFSWGHHFPIGIRLKDGWIINSDGYSKSTATHQNYLIYEIANLYDLKQLIKEKDKHKDILISNSREMKNLMDEHEDLRFITIEELNRLKILNKLEK